jgi:ParB family chromosome partitioning protein
MNKRQGLGRGLDALIPRSGDKPPVRVTVRMVPVDAIVPNPYQPRTTFDEEALGDLAASVRTYGIIQPLVVTETAEGYALIAGERRWRAAQQAGLAEVPVVVKDANSLEMLELALIENVQRADLNALEEAYAYRQLMDSLGMTQAEVADRVGKGRSTVANLVRLLDLPPSIQQAVTDGRLSGAHARALLPLPTPESQIAAMNQVLKLELSVRQTEALVKALTAESKPVPKVRPSLPPELAALQQEFEDSLGTRVHIEKGPKGGRVVIHYYSDEELQSIYDAIVGH